MAAVHALAFPAAGRWDAAAIAAQLAQPGVFGLIEPQGGMVLAREAAGEAEILTIAVAPEARRRGVGRALMLAAAGMAAARGAQAMFLEVAETNAAARALYESLGYRPVGRRKRYYPDGADALVLSCPLSPAAAADA